MSNEIPQTQRAVQLIGPDELILNTEKAVHTPGPYQILCRVEAVGLCFSDLKLLKQFTVHVRKSGIVSGIEQDVLKEIPSFVPGEMPTVPGHEAVVIVCAMGDKVTDITLGGRYLVQTDYRWLKTAQANAALGYNFEGALQQYVLMDQRVITSPEGESMLIPASENLSASAIALVEPWACVEDSYAVNERTTLKPNGQMLIVADEQPDERLFIDFIEKFGKPELITCRSQNEIFSNMDVAVVKANDISALDDAPFDDVIYFGSNAETAESLFCKVAPKGLFNIVLCGNKFGSPVVTQVGRVHYGGIRIIGTTSNDPGQSMQYIPSSSEIRKGDNINVVGAAGPMGVMHVVRDICQGVEDVRVFAGDLDDDRLAVLTKIARPLAEKNSLSYQAYNPARNNITTAFGYTIIMVPVPELVAASIASAAANGIINIFAGIPATVSAPMDLDDYIEKQLYFIGTSGSTLDDMKTILAKVEAGTLDTNLSVGAICGLGAAVEGIRAVENRTIAGKIIVYPSCKDLPLVTLDKLEDKLAPVAARLCAGLWTKEAEDALLEIS